MPSLPPPVSPELGLGAQLHMLPWSARREILFLERAKLRAAVAVELAPIMCAADTRSAALAEELLRAVMWNGTDSFASTGRDLAAQIFGTVRSIDALVAWYASADARLGEYER